MSGSGSGSSSGSGSGAAAFVEDLSKLVPKGQRLVVKLKPQPPPKMPRSRPLEPPEAVLRNRAVAGEPPVDPSYFPEEVEEDSGASGADEQDGKRLPTPCSRRRTTTTMTTTTTRKKKTSTRNGKQVGRGAKRAVQF